MSNIIVTTQIGYLSVMLDTLVEHVVLIKKKRKKKKLLA